MNGEAILSFILFNNGSLKKKVKKKGKISNFGFSHHKINCFTYESRNLRWRNIEQNVWHYEMSIQIYSARYAFIFKYACSAHLS